MQPPMPRCPQRGSAKSGELGTTAACTPDHTATSVVIGTSLRARAFQVTSTEPPFANYRELPQILPEDNEYELTICPAAMNFSGFPPDTARAFRRRDATEVVEQLVLNEGVCVDDVILVTERRGWLGEFGNENEDVVEYVVRGWEELLRNGEAGSEESEEEPGAGDESDMSV